VSKQLVWFTHPSNKLLWHISTKASDQGLTLFESFWPRLLVIGDSLIIQLIRNQQMAGIRPGPGHQLLYQLLYVKLGLAEWALLLLPVWRKVNYHCSVWRLTLLSFGYIWIAVESSVIRSWQLSCLNQSIRPSPLCGRKTVANCVWLDFQRWHCLWCWL
jgi:hypothetical protein